MQTSNRLFDDLAKVANGAAATLTGVKGEVEAMIRHQLERLLADSDLVPREEFDAMADVARRAREEQEKLEKRVAALEKKLADLAGPGKAPRTARKAESKRPAPRKAGKPAAGGAAKRSTGPNKA